MSKPGNIWRKVHGKITKKPTNFSWLIEDKLAGSGMPTSSDEFDWILKQGVTSIVTMTENALPEEWVSDIGYLHVPTPDFTAPDMDKFEQIKMIELVKVEDPDSDGGITLVFQENKILKIKIVDGKLVSQFI